MMIENNQVLLVRHTYMAGWFLPGGGVNRGETLEQAACREAHEEVGAEIKSLALIGIYSNFAQWKSDHNVVFACHDFIKRDEHDHEIAEVCSFPLDQLPDDLWPGHRQRLEEYRAGMSHPQFGKW